MEAMTGIMANGMGIIMEVGMEMMEHGNLQLRPVMIMKKPQNVLKE